MQLDLLREAVRIGRRRVAFGLLIAVSALATLSVLLTLGRAFETSRDVLGQIDDAQVRAITVRVNSATIELTPDLASRLQNLTGVRSVAAFGEVFDVYPSAVGPGAHRLATYPLLEDTVPQGVRTVAGRPPRPFEAVLGVDAVRQVPMERGLGTLQAVGDEHVIGSVGIGEFSGVYDFLNRAVTYVVPADAHVPVRQILVEAKSGALVTGLTRMIQNIVGPLGVEPNDLVVEGSADLAVLQNRIDRSLESQERLAAAASVLFGISLVAAVTMADTALQRRDIGRRRALGATRGQVAFLVLAQALGGVSLGAGVGALTGTLVVAERTGTSADLYLFALQTATLVAVAAIGAAVPGAVFAASREPARILRVP